MIDANVVVGPLASVCCTAVDVLRLVVAVRGGRRANVVVVLLAARAIGVTGISSP